MVDMLPLDRYIHNCNNINIYLHLERLRLLKAQVGKIELEKGYYHTKNY